MEAWMRHTRLGSHSQWEQTQGNSTGVLTEELACTATRLSPKQGNELENSTEIQRIKPRKWLFSELIPRTCVNCSYCKDKERDTYSLLTSTQAVTGSVQQDSFTFQFIWVSSFHNSFNICKLSAAVTGLLSLSHIMPRPYCTDLLHYCTAKAQDCPAHIQHFHRAAQNEKLKGLQQCKGQWILLNYCIGTCQYQFFLGIA